MKAIVHHGQRDFRVDDVPDPKIQEDTDAGVRIERTAICGSDLHLDPGEIITHRMPPTDGVRGYEIFDAHEEDVLKVVLAD